MRVSLAGRRGRVGWIVLGLGLLALLGRGVESLRPTPGETPASGSSSVPGPGPSGPQVLLVGVDALDDQVLGALIARGQMPHLAQLVASGVSGRLDVDVGAPQILSPIVWTSCATGKRMDKHGITGWAPEEVAGSEAGEFTSEMRRAEAVWGIASAHGLRVHVTGWLVTWPPEEVDGVVAPEFVVERPLDGWCPVHLRAAVRDVFRAGDTFARRERRRLLDGGPVHGDRWEESLFHALYLDYVNVEIAKLLSKEEPAALEMVYLEGTDIVSHNLWRYHRAKEGDPSARVAREELRRYGGTVERYYQQVDRWVGELQGAVGPGTHLIVVSDHGFTLATRAARAGTDLDRDLFDLDELLHRLGYLAVTPSGIDWGRTRAYRDAERGGDRLGVWLNLEGREPRGTVAAGDRDAVLRALSRKLAAVRTDDGRPLFERVEDGVGPRGAGVRVPDVTLWLREDLDAEGTLRLEGHRHSLRDFVRPYFESGDHDRDATYVMSGPLLARNRRYDGFRILDVAPTILYLLGLPVGRDMDGQVTGEVLPAGLLERRPVMYVTSHERGRGSRAPGQVTPVPRGKRELLRSLGYVE